MSRSRNLRDQRRTRRANVRALLRPKLSEPLMAAWDHACWAFRQICDLFVTPASLAGEQVISRARHAELSDLIVHLELLARRIIMVAAFALDIVLKTLNTRHRARTRRRVIAWPHKPEGWRASFRMWGARKKEGRDVEPGGLAKAYAGRASSTIASFPLARRLEAVRRALANPDAHARRFATRLARIRKAQAEGAEPRLFSLRPWTPGVFRPYTRGIHFVLTGMEIVHPLAWSAVDRWNEQVDPG